MPEGVMKATAHWLEYKGYTKKSNSTIFDEVFSEQVIKTGKIEDGRVFMRYFIRTKQSFFQSWFIEMMKNLFMKLPIQMLTMMGVSTLIHPRTSNWRGARNAINEYLEEQDAEIKAVLGEKVPYVEPVTAEPETETEDENAARVAAE